MAVAAGPALVLQDDGDRDSGGPLASRPANAMNQVVFDPASRSRRSGLAPDRVPGNLSSGACPLLDDESHHLRDRVCGALADGLRISVGFSFTITLPPGATILSTTRGSISLPPKPSAPATIAICSGVTSIRSCPKAILPASTLESTRVVELPVVIEPTGSRSSAGSRGRALVEPEPLGSVENALGSELEPDIAVDGVDRMHEPVREGDRAEDLRPALVREVVDLLAVHRAVARVVERRLGSELPRFECGRGCDDLEARPRDVEARTRSVQRGRAGAQSPLMREIAWNPFSTRFGSKPGEDAITLTSPVRGSSATTAPHVVPSWSTATC